ncbi:MAG: hypothetical protein KBC00_00075 [Candidatus Levybacteria bacterium]|nr:hypothetical protein [Candidatus Levybacteria bacterium]MBP9815228.1 hypothetical protein [Candidatus Levybacteria bacterium]
MKSKIIIILFCAIFVTGLYISQTFYFSDQKLHIIFCNVGQGDGIFIRTPNGTDIIIDAGPGDAIIGCLNRHMPFWDRTIELAFATHPDADHIAGFDAILRAYTILSFNTSKKNSTTDIYKTIQAQIAQQKIPVRYLFAGDTYKIGDGVVIKNYWPTHEFVDTDVSDSTNRYSLVQIIKYKEFDALVNGDIEFDILNELFKNGADVSILKLPHHGSKTGIDDRTLELIHAKLAILSFGLHNRYNHPSTQVIDLLEKFNVPYVSTAKSGDIEIVTDGKIMKVL